MLPAAQILPTHDSAYIPELQCLRGVAAMAVLIAHITYSQHSLFPDYPPFLPEIISFWGVDIFFVVSGFIIAYITTHTPAGAANAKHFLLCRLIRVVPAYWFYTLITCLMSIFIIGEPVIFKEFWHSLLFVSTSFPILMTGWTLTYEMFFYVTFAILMVFFNHRLRVIGTILILTALVSIRLFDTISNEYVRLFSHPIMLEFIAGLLIGNMPATWSHHRWAARFSLLAGLVSMSLCSVLLKLNTLLEFRVMLWGLPAALIVWGALNISPTTRSILLEKLGNVSYSIYLIHVPITGAIAIILHRFIDPSINPTGPHCVLSVLVTIALAGVSYKFIEQGTSRWLKRVLCVR